MLIPGSIWLVKSSIPAWWIREDGSLVRVGRINTGSVFIFVAEEYSDSDPLSPIFYEGCICNVFRNDVLTFCCRII